MQLTLAETTARLADLVATNLAGAELLEFREVESRERENDYIVRWVRGELGEKHGTHRAVLHADGRAMLMWGHYVHDEAEAEHDYAMRPA